MLLSEDRKLKSVRLLESRLKCIEEVDAKKPDRLRRCILREMRDHTLDALKAVNSISKRPLIAA